jgi:hypothetical protein
MRRGRKKSIDFISRPVEEKLCRSRKALGGSHGDRVPGTGKLGLQVSAQRPACQDSEHSSDPETSGDRRNCGESAEPRELIDRPMNVKLTADVKSL